MTDNSNPNNTNDETTPSRAIPTGIPIRRVSIPTENDWNLITARYNHENALGTTPGGTMYGTTPGGTRIMYDRVYLLQAKDKAISHTPPTNPLPRIPGVTCDIGEQVVSDEDESNRRSSGDSNPSNQGQPLGTISEGQRAKNDGSGDQRALGDAHGARDDDSDSDYQEHEME